MLLQMVCDETSHETICEAGCGSNVKVDEDNFFSNLQNSCQHFSGDSGYYCDGCWPYCPCTEAV